MWWTAGVGIAIAGPPSGELEALVRATLERPALREPARPRVPVGWLPRVEASVALGRGGGPDWDVSRWTTEEQALGWRVGLRLSWWPRREPILQQPPASGRRPQIVARVTSLVGERARLRQAASGPLLERVRHRLQIAELTAQLDVLTEGAASRVEHP